ncbi:MAG: TolC family outer membrane protein [Burkholderiaceae bacterium]
MASRARVKITSARLMLSVVMATVYSSASAYSLVEAYQDALDNDAELAAARASLEADKQLIPLARSQTLPSIGASADISRERFDPSGLPARTFTSQVYGVSLSYPLYNAQNSVAVDQSKLQVNISEARLAAAEQDLVLRVAEAFFDVLAAENDLATTQAEKTAIGEQLAAAKRNFEVGTATITDQQEAQARFDLAVAQELAAENALEVQRSALQTLTGKPAEQLDDLAPGAELKSPQPTVESAWTAQARSANLQVQQAMLGAEVAKREIDRQRYAGRPSLNAIGSVAHTRNPSSSAVGVRANTAAVGLQLSVPLYTGGAITAGVTQAGASLDEANSTLEVARRQAEQGARQLYLGLISGLSQVKALEAAEKSSQLALDSNRLGYRVGVRINIDVLNAQQQLFSTQRDLARARYDVLVNGLRLKSSTASLSAQDLSEVSALLAPVELVEAEDAADAPADKKPKAKK